MIYLIPGTDIQMDLSGAATTVEPECHVSYIDQLAEVSPEGVRSSPGTTQRSVTAGTTDVVICTTPAQGRTRAVGSITFNNRDTAAVTVRIWTDDGTNERELFGPRAVAAGDVVYYEHGSGWGIA